MQLQIGDKVSFIDEKREGTVTKILNPSTVQVEIEDGFEIPVLIKNLIRITPTQKIDISKIEPEIIKESITEELEYFDEDDELTSPLFVDKKNAKKTVFLAFEPLNQKDLVPDMFNIFLCNASDCDILFSCFLKQNEKYTGFCYDAVSSNSRYLIHTIEDEDLEKWQHLRLQLLFYTTQENDIKEPIDKEIFTNPVKFFQKGSYVYLPELKSYCIPFYLYEEVVPQIWEEEQWEQDKIDKIPVRNIKEMLKEHASIAGLDKKHVAAPYIAEVDLHIEQLVEDDRGLSSYEKLNIQLDYFSKCLDAAIVQKFKKITFIHGVGQGRLKEEIHKIIKESYEGVKIQDAPFKKYGVGATEVLIPFNLTL